MFYLRNYQVFPVFDRSDGWQILVWRKAKNEQFMATDVICFVAVYLFYIDTMLYFMEKMLNNVCPILV